MYRNLFRTREAEPLRSRRNLAPRISRGLASELPRSFNTEWTVPWTFRRHGISTDFPRPRFVHGYKLSVATLIPRSFHFHSSSAPMIFQRTQSFHEQSIVMDYPLPRSSHGHDFAASPSSPTTRDAISKTVPFIRGDPQSNLSQPFPTNVHI